MITIKDNEIHGFLSVPFHQMLIDVLMFLEHLYPNRVMLTCGHRPGDKGVHGQDVCRGIDIRSRVFPKPQKVVNTINKTFQYDPNRLRMVVAILHGDGSNEHIHLQVHPNTIRIEI